MTEKNVKEELILAHRRIQQRQEAVKAKEQFLRETLRDYEAAIVDFDKFLITLTKERMARLKRLEQIKQGIIEVSDDSAVSAKEAELMDLLIVKLQGSK